MLYFYNQSELVKVTHSLCQTLFTVKCILLAISLKHSISTSKQNARSVFFNNLTQTACQIKSNIGKLYIFVKIQNKLNVKYLNVLSKC